MSDDGKPWTRRFRQIRVVEMLRATNVTPRMRRVTLGGAEAADLPLGPTLKLLIPPPGLGRLEWPAETRPLVWPDEALRPAVRTYSVRRQDLAAGELEVDFVLHGDGPAATWAATAKPGDVIGISRPSGREIAKAAWICVAGDHTAVPAITAMLETMPRETTGHVFMEVPGPEEEQPVSAPPGVAVTWLHARPDQSRLAAVFKDVPWPDHDDVGIWVGAESDTARSLRAYVRDVRGVDRRRFLVIGYWKRGMSETAYGEALDHDRDADYFAVALEEEAARHGHAHGGHRHHDGKHDHAH
ncbi:siderophore-interacting protein [Enterovirga rhinocerotis]|uniref:NADPH-dependent ferric siderophore reductase n=1 Tax=Enterovirga rhinocerotis TaxID=1339210 RepID=A0A4R7BNJ4_9HYPH|nr:siderophore-interacting protein [Enterovirga rhinocerotis]TDR87068.1 NADPH-dependent ferric siderophore reductase [Enterovirga rhinocerotis]